jgi:hypothetical protein
MLCALALMDQEHPIPQQISSYQFRLVGDMTLKQFFQVAGGALIAIIIYSSTLPAYVKWPLIIFFFLFGVALAFLPIQDRPLSVWLLAFFKSIYSPTLYVWNKDARKKDYFQPENSPIVTPPLPQVPLSTSLPIPEPSVLNQPIATFTKTAETIKTPIKKQAQVEQQTPAAKPAPQPAAIPVPQATSPVVEQENKTTEEEVKEQKPKNTSASYLSPSVTEQLVGGQQAQFSPDSAPPSPPSSANVIVGQVVGPNGEIVENAILEIKDSEGRSVRALRSNKVGHFMIVTPLADGKYEIETEKEGYVFDPITIEAKGEIIPPMAIRAKLTESTQLKSDIYNQANQ